ncbi:unnamed protein product [Urochloa humidicola]
MNLHSSQNAYSAPRWAMGKRDDGPHASTPGIGDEGASHMSTAAQVTRRDAAARTLAVGRQGMAAQAQ